ncbi:MAG: hypothetical protein CMJ01_04080 [Pelagibacteraceae bacterium]|nr:hypothetical protein [Pelagibacteraceae bacterium]|tara:strand:- start:6254 stop:7159 length:906 start_codon:yes stop_codon:yes gene_type:complete
MEKLRIGIIGAGKHFKKNIFPIIKNNDSFKIVSIMKHHKREFNKYTFVSEKDFFKKKMDFLYISSPNTSHEKYILKGLNSNCHIICEKPFLTKKKKLKKIIDLSRKKKKLIFEAFMYMHHPLFKQIEKIIRSKKYGKLKYIIANWKHPHLDKNYSQYKKDQGAGFWYDGASYLISFDNYFFVSKKKMTYFKLKKEVDLRGNIQFNSNKINRFYFWGEGQFYKNDIELFFEKATIFVEQFFAKRNEDKIKIKIYKNFKLQEKKIPNKNQFKEMFTDIFKHYKSTKYQNYHRKRILDQIKYLI